MTKEDIIQLINYIINNTDNHKNKWPFFYFDLSRYNKKLSEEDIFIHFRITIVKNITNELFNNKYTSKKVFDTIYDLSNILKLCLSSSDSRICCEKRDLNKLKLLRKLLNEK